MGQFFSAINQAFPPRPVYSEKDYPDLTGKVYIVTGSNTGVGKHTARLLYLKNAHVFLAARNEAKTHAAIIEIRAQHPGSQGTLTFLPLDLADLTTIKGSAERFLSLVTQVTGGEQRLDVLINNAGVMIPPVGSQTAQGYELQLGTNCLGHFLFTKLLTPVLAATASKERQAVSTRGGGGGGSATDGPVRVIWVSSSGIDLLSPAEGVPMDDNWDWTGAKKEGQKDSLMMRFKIYGISKAGNYFHATEYAKRFMKDGIVSVSLNPGNLSTELTRHDTSLMMRLTKMFLLHPAIYGAYTELFATLSPEITLAKSGCWVIPWGRFGTPRKTIVVGSISKRDGGTGLAERFWEWSEEQVQPYI